ncbi:MAG: hypothetical protein J0G33_08190 [Afipia felis]|nr:hypothetical protein [Afipia felis]
MSDIINSLDERSLRERLVEAMDGHTLHYGKIATNALVKSVAGVSEIRDVPESKIGDVIHAIRQDRVAAAKAKVAR